LDGAGIAVAVGFTSGSTAWPPTGGPAASDFGSDGTSHLANAHHSADTAGPVCRTATEQSLYWEAECQHE